MSSIFGGRRAAPPPHAADAKPETIIGATTSIHGDVKAEGTLRVDGLVEGSVESAGNVIIGPTGRVSASVNGQNVLVAGVVTHRQRPATAAGTTFINLEDETGLMNVVVSVGCWLRYRTVARTAAALLVRGRLERNGDVVNVVAERIEPLPLGAAATRSRDFR